MTIDASGNGYLVWTDLRDGTREVYMQKISPAGSSTVDDLTLTAIGQLGSPLSLGTATIAASGFTTRNILLRDYITTLGNDFPLGDSWKTYTVGWSASGYRAPATTTVSVRRSPADPYLVEYDPSNTVEVVTDRWGSLSGKLTASDTASGLAGATVRIEGNGASRETTTDGTGSFSFAQLVPGTYQMRTSAANYVRATGSVSVPALGDRRGREWQRLHRTRLLARSQSH